MPNIPVSSRSSSSDRSHFANTVLWLEDQKIRHYKIEDRENLRKVDNLAEWEEAYTKYKADLKVPDFQTPVEEISWLLSYAVRLEYLDDGNCTCLLVYYKRISKHYEISISCS